MKTIAILGASRTELKYFKNEARYEGFGVLFLEIGNEAKNIITRISTLLDNYKIDFAILVGFAGSLVKEIKAGDIIIPLKFLSPDLKEECYPDTGLINLARDVKNNKKFKAHFPKINLAVERVCFQDDKARLAQTHPETASLDIEAFIAAKTLAQKGLPFLVVKGISDELDFSFKDFSFLFDSKYEMSIIRLVLYCIRYPQEIVKLNNFIQDCRSAAKNNVKFLRDFLKTAEQSQK